MDRYRNFSITHISVDGLFHQLSVDVSNDVFYVGYSEKLEGEQQVVERPYRKTYDVGPLNSTAEMYSVIYELGSYHTFGTTNTNNLVDNITEYLAE